ncbi:phosphatase inhibitor-domain-containing protein [Chlamydoabsidia padenii]|nr:phosphatase inhibitor-domain-containing protein [Chlamydoabsidia padenii]
MSNPTTHTLTSTRMRDHVATPSHGSRTITVDETTEDDTNATPPPDDSIGVLRLRGDMTARRPPVVRWDDDVVDNEHMGKKKSKICCIYHKPRQVGESSDSDSSSDSSSSDDSTDSDSRHSKNCRHHGKARAKKNPRSVSPNAYEVQPVYKTRPQPSRNTH